MSFIDGAIDVATALIGDAAVPYALITQADRYIGTFIADVTVREVHTDEFTITVHPVQTGTPISDHVFANPKLIEITCGASDSTGGYAGYVQDVYQEILALAATREPFDVSTGKRLYQNMLFGNITVVTDPETEFALMVTVRLQEVIITDTDDVSGASANPSDQAYPQQTSPDAGLGNQAPQAAPTAPSFTNYMGYFNGSSTVPIGGGPGAGGVFTGV